MSPLKHTARYLTEAEKGTEVYTFNTRRRDPQAFRDAHPTARGGEGYIDREVLPLVDALNAIDGVCTVQSCCGHINKHGYAYHGQLWLRLSAQMTAMVEDRIGELLAADVIIHVQKLFSYREQGKPHEILDVQFYGSNGPLPEGVAVSSHPTGRLPEEPYPESAGAPDRMAEAQEVISVFFQEAAARVERLPDPSPGALIVAAEQDPGVRNYDDAMTQVLPMLPEPGPARPRIPEPTRRVKVDPFTMLLILACLLVAGLLAYLGVSR